MCLHRQFYVEDCKSVGVKTGEELQLPLPLPADYSQNHYDITKEAEKVYNPNSYNRDPMLDKIDFRLADMSYYHKRGDKLVDDINMECFMNEIYKVL